ncbi:Ferric/cupric reductase transmembrane component [Lachnellula suecica]|uniref:ferric-chelate reductase (NADPH) n=1 Tax=Lachnellula suecica TaxID=602035 RepID=A0A8T9CBZ8_9HELO|nr:Ferric/cupric reductase transmembrane component [Lachnellula suecica]
MSSITSRHSHDAMGGMMTMAAGVPGLFYMQQIFWAFVGTAIAVATIANVINRILYHQRITSSKSVANAAKPKSFFFQAHATTSAIIREFSYYSKPLSFRNKHLYLPPMGPVIMMVGYIVLIVVCVFYRLNPKDLLQWEDIGYRAGFIAVCQMPLIVLLAGKRNIIGLLTGVGYERLNWLHRWTARALLFTVFIHMGYWFTEWAKFDYIGVKVKTDALTQKGIAAGSILLWLVLSSVAPIRGLSYEFFVVQHVISWLGFFAALYLHIPDENKIWIWLPLAFWAFDRLLRAGYLVYANLSVLHKNNSGVLACKATFEPLDESHTCITIANPPVTWKAGQHIFLACHPLAPLSSHPFTIASLPEDGKLEFVVRAKKGATKKFFKYAEKTYPNLPSSTGKQNVGRSVLIDGPYAAIRPLRQFDSLVFVAGSTGATFTVPLMRDIVQNWMGTKATSSRLSALSPPAGAVTRHIRFVWVVKRKSAIGWFASQLDQAVRDIEALRNEGHDITLSISIYLTCDDTLTSGQSSFIEGKTPPSQVAVNSRDSFADEKKAATEDVEEVSLSRVSSSSIKDCCCTRVVTDEDAITSPCNCASTTRRQQRASGSTTASYEKPSRIVDAKIHLLAGRPHVQNIIRKTAELALGEMAVVVCGPPGLVQCTRNAVVKVSDERAVHKGTGAQGIYVHAEAFGYA